MPQIKSKHFCEKTTQTVRLLANRLVFAGFRLEDIKLRELAGQNEIAVIHRQIAGDSVIVKLA